MVVRCVAIIDTVGYPVEVDQDIFLGTAILLCESWQAIQVLDLFVAAQHTIANVERCGGVADIGVRMRKVDGQVAVFGLVGVRLLELVDLRSSCRVMKITDAFTLV